MGEVLLDALIDSLKYFRSCSLCIFSSKFWSTGRISAATATFCAAGSRPFWSGGRHHPAVRVFGDGGKAVRQTSHPHGHGARGISATSDEALILLLSSGSGSAALSRHAADRDQIRGRGRGGVCRERHLPQGKARRAAGGRGGPRQRLRARP